MSVKKILCIGAATRDVFLTSPAFTLLPSPTFASGYGACVALGEKITVSDCILTSGGGATNAAVTFSRLGYTTGILANVGDDEPGRSILEELSQEAVDTTLIQSIPHEKTAYSTLLTTSTGERSVLIFRGVSGNWNVKTFPEIPPDTHAIYITSLGGSIPVWKHILLTARARGIAVYANPGAQEIQDTEHFFPLLTHLQGIIINKEEANTLLKKEKDSAQALLHTLRTLCPLSIITDGAEGSFGADSAKMLFVGARKDVRSLSRTGAGDAFGSACVSSLLRGDTLEDAMRIGTLNAEQVIQYVGAKTGILSAWPTKNLLEKIPYRFVEDQ